MSVQYIMPLPPRWEPELDCGWVTFKSGADLIRGYIAMPKDARKLPAIVTVHENPGVIEHRQDVTRRIAKHGYVSLTVDLYSRIGGQPPRGANPDDRRLKAAIAARDEQSLPDLEAGCRYLESLDAVDSSRIGALGYCMGGGLLYGWACGKSTNIKAGVVFYGSTSRRAEATPDGKPYMRAEAAPRLQIPLQIHHGEADVAIEMGSVRAMFGALKTSGRAVDLYTYPNSGHAFHDDTHPGFDAGASDEAWARTLSFFASHLSSAAGHHTTGR